MLRANVAVRVIRDIGSGRQASLPGKAPGECCCHAQWLPKSQNCSSLGVSGLSRAGKLGHTEFSSPACHSQGLGWFRVCSWVAVSWSEPAAMLCNVILSQFFFRIHINYLDFILVNYIYVYIPPTHWDRSCHIARASLELVMQTRLAFVLVC